MENTRVLKRYTDITSAIDILVNKKLTLVDPQSWEDKNDSYYMSVYKSRRNLKSLCALCFTSAPDTYHHWKVFSGNTSGICILFHTDKIFKRIQNLTDIKYGFVEYKTLIDLDKSSPELTQLPFIKRYAFRDEKEFRIIYESELTECLSFDLKIEIADIDRIFLSPWIHPSLVASAKDLLKNIPGCEKLKITRSTLIGNENWKKYANIAI